MSRKSPFSASLAVECLEGRAMPSATLATTDPFPAESISVTGSSGTFRLTFNGQTTPADGGGKSVYTITFGGSLAGSPLASVTDLVIDPFDPSSSVGRGDTIHVMPWSWGESK